MLSRDNPIVRPLKDSSHPDVFCTLARTQYTPSSGLYHASAWTFMPWCGSLGGETFIFGESNSGTRPNGRMLTFWYLRFKCLCPPNAFWKSFCTTRCVDFTTSRLDAIRARFLRTLSLCWASWTLSALSMLLRLSIFLFWRSVWMGKIVGMNDSEQTVGFQKSCTLFSRLLLESI